MAVQLLTYTRAINVIPSADVNIPNPALLSTSGTSSTVYPFGLRDEFNDFDFFGVRPGDIVYNTTDSTAAIVVGNVDPNTVELSADIFPAGGESYLIYQGAQNDASKNGCVIRNSASTTDITVVTLGGDTVTFPALPANSILPVQVSRVVSNSSGGQLIALW